MSHSVSSIAMYIASAVFVLGLGGSTVVVLISFVDDFFELFSKEEHIEFPHPPRT